MKFDIETVKEKRLKRILYGDIIEVYHKRRRNAFEILLEECFEWSYHFKRRELQYE